MVLLGARPLEKVIVRERLQPRRLADGEAAALCRVVVDEVVTILGDVGRDGCGRPARALHAEAVVELGVLQRLSDVLMLGQQLRGKIFEQRRAVVNAGEGRDKEVAVKVGRMCERVS